MAVKRQKIRPVSPLVVVGILIICGLSALFVMPSKREMLDRQLRDANIEGALKTFRRISEYEKGKDPFFYKLVELRLGRMTMTQRSEAFDKQLSASYSAYVDNGFRPEFLEEILVLTRVHPEPLRAEEISKAWMHRLPSRHQEKVVGKLVEAFLGIEQPLHAAQLYANFYQRVPPTEARLMQLVDLWEKADQLVEALPPIDEYLPKASDQEFPRVIIRKVGVLRSLGRPDEAFETAKAAFDKASPEARDQLYSLMVSVAEESNKIAQVIEEMKRRAEADPANVEGWVRLGKLGIASGRLEIAIYAFDRLTQLQPDEPEHLFQIAQLYQWSSKPMEAFDTYLKVLGKGQAKRQESVIQLLALNAGLFRDVELAEALEKVPEFHDNTMRIQIARMHARSGNADKAKQWFEAGTREGKPDPKVLQEYGGLLLTLFQFEEAQRVLEKALELEPDEPMTLLGLSEALMRLNQYEESYRILQKLSDNQEPAVLEKYITLAESLGKLDGLMDGLQKKIQANIAGPREYLRMAYFLRLRGDSVGQITSLTNGLVKFPQDPELRMQTAYYHAGRKDYLEAAHVLEGSALLKTNTTAMQVYTSMLIQGQKYPEAESFIRNDIPASIRDSEVFMGFQANIAEALERTVEAEEIFHKLYLRKPEELFYVMNYARLMAHNGKAKTAKDLLSKYWANPTPPIMKLTAQVLATGGEYFAAEAWHRRYLTNNPPDLPQAYGFLGDILLSRGDKVNARAAYADALTTLLTQIVNESQKPAGATNK